MLDHEKSDVMSCRDVFVSWISESDDDFHGVMIYCFVYLSNFSVGKYCQKLLFRYTPPMSPTYSDLVNTPTFGKKRENFSPERGDVSFYCKDCGTIVEAERIAPPAHMKKKKEYLFQCPLCKGTNIAIGTTETLKEFYSKKH